MGYPEMRWMHTLLETFKVKLDRALSKPGELRMSLLILGAVGQEDI